MTTMSRVSPRLTEAFLPADTSHPLADMTLGDLLAARAAEFPDRLALIGTRHGSGELARLTYRQFSDEASRIATGISRLAAPGSFVALWAPNVIEWPLIEFGAALAGVTLVALNPVLRKSDLVYALGHSGAAVLLHADKSRDYDLAAVVAEIVADGLFPDLVTVSLAETERWSPAEIDPAVIAAAPTDPDAPVMLQYTSGTTGNPKGVLLRHRSLVNVAKLTMEAVGAQPGFVALNPLPMFHTAACVIGTLGPVVGAGTHVLVQQFVPGPVLQTMRDEQVSLLFYVPAVLSALIEAQKASGEPAPHLDVVMGGAANVSADLIQAAEQHFGASVINLFGQTELAPVLSATRPEDSRDDQLHSVGRPLPHVDVKIVDPETNRVLRAGEQGEICARGYQQLIEYLNDPEATTRTVDAAGFVHTGDLGHMDERGYLFVTGRLKEMIIRGGENIAPAAVEAALARHEAVAESAVIGLPDPHWGEIVAAVIRPSGDVTDDLPERLHGHMREHVAPYMVPVRWFVADALPLTPTGKVRKFQLVQEVRDGAYREIAPRGATR